MIWFNQGCDWTGKRTGRKKKRKKREIKSVTSGISTKKKKVRKLHQDTSRYKKTITLNLALTFRGRKC